MHVHGTLELGRRLRRVINNLAIKIHIQNSITQLVTQLQEFILILAMDQRRVLTLLIWNQSTH